MVSALSLDSAASPQGRRAAWEGRHAWGSPGKCEASARCVWRWAALPLGGRKSRKSGEAEARPDL